MATAKKKIDKLSAERMGKLIAFIKSNEFLWWYERKTMKEVKLLVEKKLGFEIRTGQFRSSIKENSSWFRNVSRRAESDETLLTSEQCEKLKKGVEKCKLDIAGRGASHAAAILTAQGFRCNAVVLMGLPKRFHYWVKKGNTNAD